MHNMFEVGLKEGGPSRGDNCQLPFLDDYLASACGSNKSIRDTHIRREDLEPSLSSSAPAASGALIVYASLFRQTIVPPAVHLPTSATHDATTLPRFHQSVGSKARPPQQRFITVPPPLIRLALDSYLTLTSREPR